MSTLRTNALQSLDDAVTVQVVDLLNGTNALPFLASSEAGKGDALIAVKQAGTGSVARTQHDKNADFIHVKDFGAKGDGTTDDTAAFQAALNTGRRVYIGSDRYLVGNLTFPDNSGLVGDTESPHEVHLETSESPYSVQSLLIKKTGTSFNLKRGSFLKNLTLIKQGLPATITTNAQAATAIAAFADTAITSLEPDIYIENVLALGFNYAFYSNPTLPTIGRRTFINFRGDCTNGIYAAYGLDVDRFIGCHFWPYLSAHLSEATTQANLFRSGTAFYLGHYADWTQMYHCFSYGYNVGITLSQTNNVIIHGGGVDAAQTAGIQITGNSRFNKASDLFINSNGFGISMAAAGDNPDFKTSRCVFNAVQYGVYVTSGSYFSTNDTFMGGTGIAFTDGTIAGSVDNPYFDTVVTPLSMTASAAAKVARHNFNYNATQTFVTTNEQTFAAASTFIDKRPLAVNNGHYFEQGAILSAGRINGLTRVGPRLQNGTAGTESSDYVLSFFYQGAWVDKFSFRGANVFMPLLDASITLGAASNRWAQIYSSVGTISTSDENEKVQIQDIPDAVLDAWSKVNFAMYKMKDAVTEKGESARIHFGVIAQRVKDAFEKSSLDPFAYGVLCYDEWEATAEVQNEDGDVTQPAREAGKRYGVRYDEALILECALMRRALSKLTTAA